jgi:cytochrome c oxidase subunit 1
MVYLLWSLKWGPRASSNPWGAKGLEWETTSPPPTDNFAIQPVVDEPAYNYAGEGGTRVGV